MKKTEFFITESAIILSDSPLGCRERMSPKFHTLEILNYRKEKKKKMVGPSPRLRLLLIILFLFCQGPSASAHGKLKIVTTVAPITDIVRNVGTGYVDVTGIVPEGTDSHTFEPVPT